MEGSIIRDIIELDKAARTKIEDLKKEKETLDKKLKIETAEIKKQFDQENKKIIKERKAAFMEEITSRQEKEQNKYNETLKNIQKQYKENKDAWVKEIYEACID